MSVMMLTQTDQVHISKRFQRVVVLHMLKNMLKEVEVQIPLLLGIYGPTGEGKTAQVEHILKAMGVKRFLLSGGQMDSSAAGLSSGLVRSTYIQASEAIRSGACSMAVLLINDIDTGLGSWGEAAKFTINQISIFADLMHLVDYPNSVEGKDTVRVPIIITGNDFTKLYEPLVRAGRMTAFEWIPTAEERAEIVEFIFPELTREECISLVAAVNQAYRTVEHDLSRQLSVAFYSHLRSTLLDEDLWEQVEANNIDRVVDKLLREKEPDFSLGINFDRVLEKGLELVNSGQLINHLKT